MKYDGKCIVVGTEKVTTHLSKSIRACTRGIVDQGRLLVSRGCSKGLTGILSVSVEDVFLEEAVMETGFGSVLVLVGRYRKEVSR